MNKPVNPVRRQAFIDFSILIFLVGILTLVFRYSNLDIAMERYFYSGEKGWMLQYKPVWDFIYRFGIFPGYILAFGGLIMISVSYWNTRYIHFRKASLVLVFTIIVGPGILVNLVLKDHTGRPRPRDIAEFGGTETFLCVCDKANTNEGKSFPCGHCSMGFYLAIPYLFYRGRRKLFAYSFLTCGIAYGILIGIARMMAGGHFASDVIWAGGLTWGVALTGYYIFRPDKPIEFKIQSGTEKKKKARRVSLITGILLLLITIGLMLATPYFSKKYFDVSSQQLKTVNCKVVELDLMDATLTINPGKDLHLDYNVNAFGFPNSKIRGLLTLGDTSRYILQAMGWFTEVKNIINIEIPVKDSIKWNIRINHGKVFCNLPDNCHAEFFITVRKGNLFIRSNPQSIILIGDPARVDKKLGRPLIYTKKPINSKGTTISFNVQGGRVFVE